MIRPNRKDFEIHMNVAKDESAKGIHHFSFEQHMYIDQLEAEKKESIKNMERIIGEQKETIDSFRLQLKEAKELLEWAYWYKRLKELI